MPTTHNGSDHPLDASNDRTDPEPDASADAEAGDIVTETGGDVTTEGERPPTLLQQVAEIVAPNCAAAGCHDAITKEHGMDLSTAASIHTGWVNQKGLDHCQGRTLTRVVPGNPNGSYVMTKITATMRACDQWDPMPPPPRPLLVTAQIETIRAWIVAGARLD